MTDLVVMFLKVGAGLPVIASLNRIISSGDPVHRIVGSLSGINILRCCMITFSRYYFLVLDHTSLVGSFPHKCKVLLC